jgi:hypothetical protein
MDGFQVSDAGEAVVQRGFHDYRPVSAADVGKIGIVLELSTFPLLWGGRRAVPGQPDKRVLGIPPPPALRATFSRKGEKGPD